MAELTEHQRRIVVEHQREMALSFLNELAKKGHPDWTKDQLKAIDKWIKRQNEPGLTRAEAVRRLVEIGLKAPRR
jgi:hypothetical protein